MVRRCGDLSGKRFGRLVVEREATREEAKRSGKNWVCLCDCGGRKVTYWAYLVDGKSRSCGCIKSEGARDRMKKMRLEKSGTLEDRFGNRFIRGDDDECWEWISHRDKDGYGILPANGPAIRAHRMSYEIHSGEKIPSGMFVCHRCDNPGCVNPNHLFIGSAKDNIRDMIEKGRDSMVGDRNNKSRLTEQQVGDIIRDGRSHGEIAKDFGVHRSTIARIKRGASWSHVDKG